MFTVSATKVTREEAEQNEISCGSYDFTVSEGKPVRLHQGCTIFPEYAVTMQPAPDMVIPVFLCVVHFNAYKLGLHEGIAVDEDMFGSFS